MKYISLIAIIAIVFLVSCNKESENSVNNVEETLTISGISDSEWTYISLETGKVIGTSPLYDEAQDALWKKRMDWDIAFCGEYMKTNGGTSGEGNGAIQRLDGKDFFQITINDATELEEDEVIK